MAPMKENLPINAEMNIDDGGTITYANEVIAIIAGVAANEIEGLAGMCTSGGLGEIISRNRNITRGVKVEVGTEEVSVDLYTIIEYGQPIQKVASEVQENVRKNIEAMTGLRVVRVDVHVQGVSFEKEKLEAQKSLSAADVPSLAEPDKKASKMSRKNKKEAEEQVVVEVVDTPKPEVTSSADSEAEKVTVEEQKDEEAHEA